jgi:hypothetical protein
MFLLQIALLCLFVRGYYVAWSPQRRERKISYNIDFWPNFC